MHAHWSSQDGLGAEELTPLLDAAITLTVGPEPEPDSPRWQALEALVAGRPSAALLDAPALRRVIVPWAGVPAELREGVLARPHLSLHNSHYNAPLVAQHALALVLACACRLVEADGPLRRGDWRPRYARGFRSRFLPGKRALLLGYGAIGQRLGAQLAALGMTVSALRRGGQEDARLERVFSPCELHRALSESDVVVASLPDTAETRGMLDEDAFAAMKAGAIFVSVGRGKTVVEAALYQALKGRLLAAGLDVWWRYPEGEATRAATLPAEHPFWELSNVIMSPHRANEMDGEARLRHEDVAATLNALARGEARNQVDPARGY